MNVHLVDRENAFVKSKKNVEVESYGFILKTSNYDLTNFLHLFIEKCTTLSHKSCIMNWVKNIVQGETPRRGFKEDDRDGTIQLYKIFVF